MVTVEPLAALKDNYIWLLKNQASLHVAIVDPGEAKPVLAAIRDDGLLPVAILVTHHHWDHVGGIAGITDKFDIPVYTPKTETVPGSTNPVGEGDVVCLPELGLELNILDVPGHTAGAVAYYTAGMVFSGDTLFTAGCGRLFEGTPQQMHQSLSKLKALPGSTSLYCGHEYTVANLQFAAAVEPDNPDIRKRQQMAAGLRKHNLPTVPATLAQENRTNPFLRCEQRSVIHTATEYAGKALSDPADVFATIRSWKDRF